MGGLTRRADKEGLKRKLKEVRRGADKGGG